MNFIENDYLFSSLSKFIIMNIHESMCFITNMTDKIIYNFYEERWESCIMIALKEIISLNTRF
jgi:hypothetical protein